MSFDLSTGFSLCYSKLPIDRDMIEAVLFSEVESFELSGAVFESEEFDEIFKKFFLVGKKISSIYEILPKNISRNWSTSPENIKKELVEHLREKIKQASERGVKFARIDLGLDSIKSGFEIHELNVRASLIAPVLAEAEKCGVTLCHPIRFPKAFPKTQEWRFGSMLISSSLHKNYKLEIDVFPMEASVSQLHNIMKKLFYYPEVIRFIYEPAMDGGIDSKKFKNWVDALKGQGFNGTIIFSPIFDSFDSLDTELSRVTQLLKDYDSFEIEEKEEDH
ncbi:MAG: hypothetical protein NE328_13380 [Lentisphaeraceae bacterium]|nr:hypothetical protein [Lentisphaeraceae bacterium]